MSDPSGASIETPGEKKGVTQVNRDVMVYSVKAGYGNKGAHLGSAPGEADAFRGDMHAFWQQALPLA